MTEHNTTAPAGNRISPSDALNIIKDHCRSRYGCSGCLFELDMEDAPDSMSTCVFCLGLKPRSWWRFVQKPDNPEDVIAGGCNCLKHN